MARRDEGAYWAYSTEQQHRPRRDGIAARRSGACRPAAKIGLQPTEALVQPGAIDDTRDSHSRKRRPRSPALGGGRRARPGAGRGGRPADRVRTELHRRLLPDRPVPGAVVPVDHRQRRGRRRGGRRRRSDRGGGGRPGHLLHEPRQLCAAPDHRVAVPREDPGRDQRRAGGGGHAQGLHRPVPDPADARRAAGRDGPLSRRGGRVRPDRLPVAEAPRRHGHRHRRHPRGRRSWRGPTAATIRSCTRRRASSTA